MSNVYTSNDQNNSSETSLSSTYSGHSHSFDTGIATKCGIAAAVLFNHLYFWIVQNKATNKCFFEGRTWMFQSVKEIAAVYPYLTIDQVRRGLENLVKSGLILAGNFHENKFNREKWYALPDESIIKSIKPYKSTTNNEKTDDSQKHLANLPNAGGESANCIYEKDTKYNITKEILSNESTKKVANAPFTPPDKKNSKKTFVSAAVQKKYVDQGKGIVKMDQDEWDKLVQEFGETQVATTATKLSEYMVSSGKIYKDHYLTIRNWIKRDLEKEKAKKPKRDFRDFPGNYTMKRDHEVEVF